MIGRMGLRLARLERASTEPRKAEGVERCTVAPWKHVTRAAEVWAAARRRGEARRMKHPLLWAVLMVTPLSVGCAPPAPATIWKKDGVTGNAYQADSYNCEKDARQSGYFGSGLIGAVAMKNFYERCMYAQGWRLETLPVSKSFTGDEWNQVTGYCRSLAEKAKEAGQETFPNAFNSCMAARGF